MTECTHPNPRRTTSPQIFYCPDCGEQWSEMQRVQANHDSVMVHDGQVVSAAGVVSGEGKRTRCFSFRYSGAHNLLVPANELGADEWKAANNPDEDEAERKMCQFVWCLPYESPEREAVDLNPDKMAEMQAGTGQGQIPHNCKWVTLGIDVGSRHCHWTAIAWLSDGSAVIFDYDVIGVRQDIPFALAFSEAIHKFRDRIGTGWVRLEDGVQKYSPIRWYDRVYIDCRWETDVVIETVKSLGMKDRWFPFYGEGAGHWSKKKYSQPPKATRKGKAIRIGHKYYESVNHKHGVVVVHADANHWKTWLQRRLVLPDDEDKQNGIRLFAAQKSSRHVNFCKHLSSEQEEMDFDPQKNEHVRTWKAVRAANHHLDSTYMSCVAGHRCGFRPDSPAKAKKVAAPVVAAPAESGRRVLVRSGQFKGHTFR